LTRPLPPLFPSATRRLPRKSRLTLLGFAPLQRIGNGNRPAPGLPGPAVLRSQVFSTSQRFVPPVSVTALFHAASTHGILPFRAFPLPKAVAPLDARYPHDVTWRFRSRSSRQAALHAPFPVRPPSGSCSFGKSVLTMPDVNPNTAADALLGFSPSKGLPRHAISTPSRALLSRTSTPAPRPEDRFPFARCPRVLLHAPCGLSPKRLPSFLGFLPLSLFTSFESSLDPGLSFHLRPRSTSPPPDGPSSGLARFD
jgi:hypothetical protein